MIAFCSAGIATCQGELYGDAVLVLCCRDSDAPSLKMSLKCKAQQSGSPSSVIRKVNFVIFVVNGFQVLRSINSDKKEDRAYVEMVAKIFSCPYMSYKGTKALKIHVCVNGMFMHVLSSNLYS